MTKRHFSVNVPCPPLCKHQVLEHCFAIAFLLELLYRVATEGRKYFHEAMNIFDTVPWRLFGKHFPLRDAGSKVRVGESYRALICNGRGIGAHCLC